MGLHCCYCSLAQPCPTLCDPMNHSMPASLSVTNSRSPPKPMSIESVMPSNHLILCHPLLLLPPIPPSIWVFSNESAFRMRWPKYWSFSFSIIPSKELFRLHLFSWASLMTQMVKNLSASNTGDGCSIPGSGRSPGEWLPIPVFLAGEFHGERSLVGYSP